MRGQKCTNAIPAIAAPSSTLTRKFLSVNGRAVARCSTHEHSNPVAGAGVREETSYALQSERQLRDDRRVNGASVSAASATVMRARA